MPFLHDFQKLGMHAEDGSLYLLGRAVPRHQDKPPLSGCSAGIGRHRTNRIIRGVGIGAMDPPTIHAQIQHHPEKYSQLDNRIMEGMPVAQLSSPPKRVGRRVSST